MDLAGERERGPERALHSPKVVLHGAKIRRFGGKALKG
jgi:hypothetical protein